MSDQRHLKIRMGELAHPCLEDLPDGAQSKHRHHDEIDQQPALQVPLRLTPEHFDERVRQQKTETEMDDPIEMVPVQVKPGGNPKAERNLGVGIVDSYGVQR